MMPWERVVEVGGGMLATLGATTAVVDVYSPQGAATDHWFVQWWPLLSACGVGLILWGEMRSKVKELDRRTEANSKVPERLTAIETKLDILLQVTPLTTNTNGTGGK